MVNEVNRFWSKTSTAGGCVLWTAGKDKDGYGKFQTGRHGAQQHHRAHRWIYERVVGPLNGRLLLHSCHNPSCVAPQHLSPGTQRENVRQAIERGLHASVTRWKR